MPYINDATGQKVYTSISPQPGGTTTNTGTTTTGTTTTNNPLVQAGSITGAYPDWHKALLWFLGAVLLIAVAGPAPNIATMIVVILIVGVLLGNWSTYAQFLNIPNAVTGGSTN